MIYAPVLIPTVSRYEHFKNCLESLSDCIWADRTEVFVAVDYPGRDKDWDGYKKICDYLSSCGDLGFKRLHVIYRETNYFFSGKGNFKCLREEVCKNFDRFILSEDDNVFSPNFLVYMNKGLERYEKDETVLALNGYCHFYSVLHEENNFIRENVDFSAWGYGIWRDRYEKFIMKISPEYFRSRLSWETFWKIKKCGNFRLMRFLNYSYRDRIPIDDNSISNLMNVDDLDVIMPTLSLVRNMGWDNTGIHCSPKEKELSDHFTFQKISEDKDFEFIGSGFERYDENKKYLAKHAIANFNNIKLCYHLIRWFFKVRMRKGSIKSKTSIAY